MDKTMEEFENKGGFQKEVIAELGTNVGNHRSNELNGTLVQVGHMRQSFG